MSTLTLDDLRPGETLYDPENPGASEIEIKICSNARQVGKFRLMSVLFHALKEAGYSNVDLKLYGDVNDWTPTGELAPGAGISGWSNADPRQKQVHIQITEDHSHCPESVLPEYLLTHHTTRPEKQA